MSRTLAELLVKANNTQNEGGLVDVEPNGQVLYGKIELTNILRLIIPSKTEY